MHKHPAHVKRLNKKAINTQRASEKVAKASTILAGAAESAPHQAAAKQVARVANNLVNAQVNMTKKVISIARKTRSPTAIRAARNTLKATNKTANNARRANHEAARTPK